MYESLPLSLSLSISMSLQSLVEVLQATRRVIISSSNMGDQCTCCCWWLFNFCLRAGECHSSCWL